MVPKLIKENRAWFLVGTGPHSEHLDVEIVNDMDEYSRTYSRLFGNDHDFAYLCTLDETLEIIDWHTFYDINNVTTMEFLEQAKKDILKKYKKWMKKTGLNSYICVMNYNN